MNFPGQNKKWEERVISAINLKTKKGKEYASWKFLVVFSEGMGKWHPNIVAKAIKNKHNFKWIYCIWLILGNENKYIYSISQFIWDNAPTYTIEINSDFTNWEIKKIQ